MRAIFFPYRPNAFAANGKKQQQQKKNIIKVHLLNYELYTFFNKILGFKFFVINYSINICHKIIMIIAISERGYSQQY